jgi:hypothetical protein
VLRRGFHNHISGALETRPCVGVKFNFLSGGFFMNEIHKSLVLTLLGKRNPELDKYYIALGEFVHAYSDVELELQRSLWHAAKVKEPIAQAVFSGVRTEAAISNINRISEARKWSEPKKTKYKYLFDQLQIINKLRNDIVHRGASLQADGTWISSNEKYVHIPERITTTPVSAGILNNASADLFEIRYRLAFLAHGRHWPVQMKEHFTDFLTHAWLYRPVPQGRKAQTNRKAHQTRGHPPRFGRKKQS